MIFIEYNFPIIVHNLFINVPTCVKVPIIGVVYRSDINYFDQL